MSHNPYRILLDGTYCLNYSENCTNQMNEYNYVCDQSEREISKNFLYGAGIPDNCLGRNQNLYLDLCTNKYYLKINGKWFQKKNCTEGGNIFSGIENPCNNIGNDGDFYLNTLTGAFFVKTSCFWAFISTLRGQQGEKGNQGNQGNPGIKGSQAVAILVLKVKKGSQGNIGIKGEKR